MPSTIDENIPSDSNIFDISGALLTLRCSEESARDVNNIRIPEITTLDTVPPGVADTLS